MSNDIISIEVTQKSLALIASIEKRSRPGQFEKDVLVFLDRQATIGADYISDNMLSNQRLRRRSGNLARSIVGRSLRAAGVPAMRIGVLRGPALRYAGVQEYGTKKYNPDSPYDTIRPKHAKALAIPQEPALTGVGIDRFGGPRGVPFSLTFIPFRGTGVAVGGLFDPATLPAKGSGLSLRTAKMYYLLVSKVDIKPKWYLKDGFDAWLPEFVEELTDWLEDYALALPKGRFKSKGKQRDEKGRFI